MATEAQRARRRSQRQTAVRVRTGRTILPKAITGPSKQARIDYGYRVLNGENPRPAKGTPEARQLARIASDASWGKADPVFLPAFQEYFYHDESLPDEPDEADEYYEPDDEDDEDEE